MKVAAAQMKCVTYDKKANFEIARNLIEKAVKKDVKLIDGTQIVTEWKEVDLESLGKVDAVNLRLTSSRPDFPLYCCLDDMGYVYNEIYQ